MVNRCVQIYIEISPLPFELFTYKSGSPVVGSMSVFFVFSVLSVCSAERRANGLRQPISPQRAVNRSPDAPGGTLSVETIFRNSRRFERNVTKRPCRDRVARRRRNVQRPSRAVSSTRPHRGFLFSAPSPSFPPTPPPAAYRLIPKIPFRRETSAIRTRVVPVGPDGRSVAGDACDKTRGIGPAAPSPGAAATPSCKPVRRKRGRDSSTANGALPRDGGPVGEAAIVRSRRPAAVARVCRNARFPVRRRPRGRTRRAMTAGHVLETERSGAVLPLLPSRFGRISNVECDNRNARPGPLVVPSPAVAGNAKSSKEAKPPSCSEHSRGPTRFIVTTTVRTYWCRAPGPDRNKRYEHRDPGLMYRSGSHGLNPRIRIRLYVLSARATASDLPRDRTRPPRIHLPRRRRRTRPSFVNTCHRVREEYARAYAHDNNIITAYNTRAVACTARGRAKTTFQSAAASPVDLLPGRRALHVRPRWGHEPPHDDGGRGGYSRGKEKIREKKKKKKKKKNGKKAARRDAVVRLSAANCTADRGYASLRRTGLLSRRNNENNNKTILSYRVYRAAPESRSRRALAYVPGPANPTADILSPRGLRPVPSVSAESANRRTATRPRVHRVGKYAPRTPSGAGAAAAAAARASSRLRITNDTLSNGIVHRRTERDHKGPVAVSGCIYR
ncbi:Hypothetical protein CINCED_3A021940 [Cinara cedri]|uniref:Uncharacterized protein n=1 Tax=Cinara cedri TaxID=506608 RepID=A0A5E4N7I4_9HEMI|nr:Hypothetical protein CINCED_3A021940 [Cinara cedri]